MSFYVESETRLFVGGMGPAIKESDVRKYFEQFGCLQECSLKCDLVSGKSKGYAFISYEDPLEIQAVLKRCPHVLNDRQLDVKRAKEIAEIHEPAQEDASSLKIFVGALPDTCTSTQLKEYFGKYGIVDACVVITDHETNQSRGFGFVTYRAVESVKRVLEEYHDHFLDGKWIETKCCLPRDNNRYPPNYNIPQGIKKIGYPVQPSLLNSPGLYTPQKKFGYDVDKPYQGYYGGSYHHHGGYHARGQHQRGATTGVGGPTTSTKHNLQYHHTSSKGSGFYQGGSSKGGKGCPSTKYYSELVWQ